MEICAITYCLLRLLLYVGVYDCFAPIPFSVERSMRSQVLDSTTSLPTGDLCFTFCVRFYANRFMTLFPRIE